MDRPTCKTCPYYECESQSSFLFGRMDFWRMIPGIGEKTATDLSLYWVRTVDDLDQFRASRKMSNVKYAAAKEALERGESWYGECRRFARQAERTWPVARADGWCGEHPDFPQWIESRKAKPDA